MSKIKTNTIENVAGTESHSVDTMGIESGSNADGNYIKFPDGTLICISKVITNYTNVANGSIFTSAQRTWTYPMVFIEEPAVSASDGNSTRWADVFNPELHQSRFFSFGATSSTTSSNVTLTAIGRWK